MKAQQNIANGVSEIRVGLKTDVTSKSHGDVDDNADPNPEHKNSDNETDQEDDQKSYQDNNEEERPPNFLKDLPKIIRSNKVTRAKSPKCKKKEESKKRPRSRTTSVKDEVIVDSPSKGSKQLRSSPRFASDPNSALVIQPEYVVDLVSKKIYKF